MCLVFLYKNCLKHFSFWEEMSEIWPQMYTGLHVMCLLFLSHFNEIWIFSTGFKKSIQMSNSIKIPSVGVELFHADGQTGIVKQIVAFFIFWKPCKTNTCIVIDGLYMIFLLHTRSISLDINILDRFLFFLRVLTL